MSLSNDLITQFVKTVKPETKEHKESIVYGTVVVDKSGAFCVRLDGCDQNADPTPIATTSGISAGHRVMVMIKNHSAIVIGNLDDPSAGTYRVNEVDKSASNAAKQAQEAAEQAKEAVDRVLEVEDLIADKVSTEQLAATNASIETLRSDMVKVTGKLDTDKLDASEAEITYAKITRVEAIEGKIEDLEADKITTEELDAKYAAIGRLQATQAELDSLEASQAEFHQATANRLDANDASINNLNTNKLSATDADVKYAKIDFSNIGKAAIEYFYATSGLIEDVVVGDGTVTGKLVGVTISGDLIEGNTVKAEKLVIKGSDGLYYKLNTDGMKTEAEQTDQNSLNGSIIKAKSITATKISVSDLVAFGATIGGIKIGEGAIYSGVKESIDNTTNGFYLDKDGQMHVGGTSQWIKYYKLQNGNYALSISAEQIIIASSGKNVDDEITSAQAMASSAKTAADNAQSTANSAEERVTEAESLIEVLSESISMLVTDGNGASLMTQTENGWTFNTADLQDLVNKTSEGLNDLTNEVGDVNSAVDVLRQAVDDLGTIAEYVKIGTYEDEPCIELGDADSDFKLLITNTRIMFMEGSDVPAYINNQSLHIKKAVVEEELRQGNFVWKVRSNGNMGLVWKGIITAAYTNQIPLSVNADGSEYVGANGEDGYNTGHRVNSSGAEVAQTGMCCIGLIPYFGQTIRLKNVTISGTKDAYIAQYYADKSFQQVQALTSILKDDGTGVYTGSFAHSGWIRITCGVIDDTSILTLDEEIT